MACLWLGIQIIKELIMAKFKNLDDYLNWCEVMVIRIYYANIAMNNEAIADVVQEIARKHHVSEGEHLIE